MQAIRNLERCRINIHGCGPEALCSAPDSNDAFEDRGEKSFADTNRGLTIMRIEV